MILVVFSSLSLIAELLVNSRPLIVHAQDRWIFPTYGAIHTGREFGFDYDYEVNYTDLRSRFATDGTKGGWMLSAPVPSNVNFPTGPPASIVSPTLSRSTM